jgi:ribosomal protein S18 acetylase RimI-like enzyme
MPDELINNVTMGVASAEDMKTIIAFAKAEGWNPGDGDDIAFKAVDPEGFFVAKVDGDVVGCISVVNHNDEFAYVGMYICRPDYRGKGIGMTLWNYAFKHAGTRNMGLDGVREQESNYVKSGFVAVMDTCRYEGQLQAQTHSGIRPAGDDDIDDLIEMDAAANDVRRERFIRSWVAPASNRKTVIFDDASGFATIRTSQYGVKIGPVVCDDTDKALMLMRACLDQIPSDQVFVDVPADNKAMVSTLNDKGFSEVFVATRMYRGKAPQISPKLHAIGSMELG